MNVNVTLPNLIPNHLYPQTESARADNRKAEFIPQPANSRAGSPSGETGSDQQKEKTRSTAHNADTVVTLRDNRNESLLQSRYLADAIDPDAGRQQGQQQSSQQQRDDQYTPQQQEELQQLQETDQDVRDHEQAHQRVGGQYAGSPVYSYTSGPDRQRYATSGEVEIDISEVPHNPHGTIDKMQIVQAAALAPEQPSSQDYSVARLAAEKEAKARGMLRQRQIQAFSGGTLDTYLVNRNQVIANRYQSAVTPASSSAVDLTA